MITAEPGTPEWMEQTQEAFSGCFEHATYGQLERLLRTTFLMNREQVNRWNAWALGQSWSAFSNEEMITHLERYVE